MSELPAQDTGPAVSEFIRDSGRVKFRRKRKAPVRRWLLTFLGGLAAISFLVWGIRHLNHPTLPGTTPAPPDAIAVPGDTAVAF